MLFLHSSRLAAKGKITTEDPVQQSRTCHPSGLSSFPPSVTSWLQCPAERFNQQQESFSSPTAEASLSSPAWPKSLPSCALPVPLGKEARRCHWGGKALESTWRSFGNRGLALPSVPAFSNNLCFFILHWDRKPDNGSMF